MTIIPKEIYLEHLVSHLQGCYLKLNLNFIQNLFIEVSSSQTPHTCKEFSQKLKVKWNNKHKVSSTIREWFKGVNNISVDQLNKLLKMSKYNWSNVESNLVYIKAGSGHSNGVIYPKFPIKLDENLGAVVGYILGDGSVYKKGLQISFANTNKELLSDFEDKMFKLFGIKPTIRYQPTKKMKIKHIWVKRVNTIGEIPNGFCGQLIYPRITGKVLISIFDKFSFGNHKQITKKILDTGMKFKIGLVRAFFDSEGCVEKAVLNIKVFQNKKDILERIKEILSECGIEPNKIHCYIKGNKRRHYFSITGFYNCLNFCERIGFVSSKKLGNLRKMLSMLEKSPSRHLRIGESKELILQLLQANKYLKRKDISILLKQIYPAHTWSNTNILLHLKDLIERDLIERIETENQIVYKPKS